MQILRKKQERLRVVTILTYFKLILHHSVEKSSIHVDTSAKGMNRTHKLCNKQDQDSSL